MVIHHLLNRHFYNVWNEIIDLKLKQMIKIRDKESDVNVNEHV